MPLASEELGTFGCFTDLNLNNLEKNILKSYNEIPLAIEKYQESVDKFKDGLNNFIYITQKEASKHTFPKDFAIENFLPFFQKELYILKKYISPSI